MSLRYTLKKYVLSDENIDNLVDEMVATFNLGDRSVAKCRKLITGYLTNSFNMVDRYPDTDEECSYALQYLNNVCREQFSDYIVSKYPTNCSKQLLTHPQIEHVTILSSYERNKLLELDGIEIPPERKKFVPMEIKPATLLHFMTKYGKVTRDIHRLPRNYAMILTEDQMKEMYYSDQSSNKCVDGCNIMNDIDISDDLDPDIDIDLENLNKNTLIAAANKIRQLAGDRKKYLENGDTIMSKKIKKTIDKIASAISRHREKIVNDIRDIDHKKKIDTPKSPRSVKQDGDILDIYIDPSTNHELLKDIVVDIETNDKIRGIVLTEYFAPKTNNNINRFNNFFSIFVGDDMIKIFVEPGKYSIEKLLESINNDKNCLRMEIVDNDKIKVSADDEFELITNDSPLLELLGFTENQIEYQDEKSYVSTEKYCIDTCDEAFICISGSSKDPVMLDFDKTVKLEEPVYLKSMTSGTVLKKICVNLRNKLGQIYDFPSPVHVKLEMIRDG